MQSIAKKDHEKNLKVCISMQSNFIQKVSSKSRKLKSTLVYHKTRNHRLQERGFTLVELSIVLVVIGLIITPMISLYSRYRISQSYKETQVLLEEMRKSISYFKYYNGRLPCPAPMNPKEGDLPAYREMDCESIRNKSELLKNENQYIRSQDSNGKRVITGYVPIYDLNLKVKESKDAWNQEILYSVTLDLTHLPFYHQEGGIIEIFDINQKKMNWEQGGAQYVLFSQGTNGCKSEGIDQKNCEDHQNYLIADFSMGNKENFYDDLILYSEYVFSPKELVKKACNVEDFLLLRNVSKKDIPQGDDKYIENGFSLKICNENILKKFKSKHNFCKSYFCDNGRLIDKERILP
jgi:prepilin-type N-terminal cleavage/methylation domain-containing protein